ncbi:uncharacterized protein [Channa argus]|uniref:uncharacterized protein n=1 Tax=Channa argus TaxID=215402 RepID=UPI00352062B9
MLSLHCLLSIQFLSILTGVSCDKLTPIKNEEFSLEGSNITLTYTYSKAAVYNDYFFWYRQYPGKPPQFLISHSGTEPNKTAKNSGLSVKMSEDKTQVDLQISSAAVSDSDVYYCAVRPTVTGNTTTLYKNTSCVSCEDLTAVNNEEFTLEGSNVTLSYKYSRQAATNDYFFCLTGVSCEDLTAVNNEEFTLESSNVPLSYKYSKQTDARDFFFWYQQHSGKPPQFLISHSASGVITIPHPRYRIKVEDKQITMIISSAAVSDSAVYYCAVSVVKI